MRIFLTGGTGLLGSHVAERLHGRGHEVVASFRPGSDTSFLRGLGCDLVEGGLVDDSPTQAGRMQGCGAVVHAAAMMYGGESLAAARRVNVEGTRRVLEGARKAGIKQAVFISSVAVYGNASGPLLEEDEANEPLRRMDHYARTKREAEDVATGLCAEGSMRVTILRLPALYGERDRWFVPRLVAQVKRRFIPLIGTARTRFPAIYVGNAAQAVELALESQGGGGIFNLGEDHKVTLRFLYEAFAEALNLRPRFLTIPRSVARTGALLGEALGLGIPGARDLSLRRIVRLAAEDNPYSSEKARTLLRWKPTFTLEEAMARTGAWIRERERTDCVR
ncbi:MAG: NAD-dependent epimerase/dehydratase family protein [Longimicrobiales bacterium]